MAKLQDKFFNRIIEGDAEFQENEQIQVQALMEKGEPMSGYSAEIVESDEYKTIEPIYVGVCKNGNKITFVSFLAVTPLVEDLSGVNSSIWVTFNIPASVGAKLYPYQIAGYYYLANRTEEATQYDDYSRHQVNVDVTKGSNTSVNLIWYCATTAGNLTPNKKYLVRIEQTFLLSDNLIPNA